MRTPPPRRIRRKRPANGFTPRRRSAEHGFTLVELMVVIVIIGLLATIVALNVLPSGDTARVQKAKADIAQIEGGLEMYKLQNLTFPTTSQGLQALVTMPAGLADPSRYQKGGYLKKLPDDPWGRPYLYASPGQHGEADVWTYGADGKEGGEGINADIGNWDK
ncbi:type II secretion system major pseudopilin GspG [Sphingomonas yabuuchiae]|uniref:type II secretion system major pseudopilin GspG n=1 Tax=Sphingomonas yabuuchiae TaxID=172044 RepID=UPI0025DBB754|nr:type II secretion system major pseudopilin GspG [uncultured Sphingomonas sp.]